MPANTKKPNRVDIGLEVLIREQRPGETFEAEDIARVCGCTARNIQLIAERAKAKLRFQLYRSLGGFRGELPGIPVPVNVFPSKKKLRNAAR